MALTKEQFEAMTGVELTTEQAARFETVEALAASSLELLLGYPLDPTDWENQYEEIGKSQSECACPDVDTDNLDDPDPVVGEYRFFDWYPHDQFMAIDPASEIHAVKLVKDGITYRTFDPDEYRKQYDSGTPLVIKYLQLCRDCLCQCVCEQECVQVAVDADWLYDDELPLELQKVLAELIQEEYDDKSDLQSESLSQYSYTKTDEGKMSVAQRHIELLRHYAGANGTAKRKRII